MEVVWGIDHYYDALFVRHESPLFTPLVFHPGGWQTATLAHTPALFLLAQPLRALGGAAFAVNALILFSTGVAFAGSFRLARLFASPFPATVCALVYTFWAGRWFNAGAGHLNVLWVSSLLPWLAWSLERLRRDAGSRRLWVWVCGLVWGLMINTLLQSVLIGAVVFLVLGRSLGSVSTLKRLAGIVCIALVVATPAWLPFVIASRQSGMALADASHISFWGASLNSLFIPSLLHPVAFVRDLANSAYSGLITAAVKGNLGLVTAALGLAGAIIALRQRGAALRFAGLALASLVLAMGLLLNWNGGPVASPLFTPLNEWIWQVGRQFKPRVFDWLAPPPAFQRGIPLPALLLTAVVPLWEAGRVMSRFGLVAAVALIPLTATALQSMKPLLRWLVVGLWLLEGLPAPTGSYPLPRQAHPAYAWVAAQSFAPGEGIAEMDYRTLAMAGEALYATTFHHQPTASGVGTFWPLASIPLRDFIEINARTALETPGAAYLLSQYRVRYVLLEMKGEYEERIWQQAQHHPDFKPVRCFPPLAGPSPWPNPICVIEVKPAPAVDFDTLQLGAGWHPTEAWGTWAEG